MGGTHGFHPWVEPMGSTHGFDSWARAMGQPMGRAHGPGPGRQIFLKQGRPTLLIYAEEARRPPHILKASLLFSSAALYRDEQRDAVQDLRRSARRQQAKHAVPIERLEVAASASCLGGHLIRNRKLRNTGTACSIWLIQTRNNFRTPLGELSVLISHRNLASPRAGHAHQGGPGVITGVKKAK